MFSNILSSFSLQRGVYQPTHGKLFERNLSFYFRQVRLVSSFSQNRSKVHQIQTKQNTKLLKKNKIKEKKRFILIQKVKLPEFVSKSHQLVVSSNLDFPKVSEPFENPKNFTEIGIHSSISDALSSININCPTVIQSMAIPQILKGLDVFCAAQTGTGKTLAYLLPILHTLWEDQKNPSYRRRGQRARALILVPTRELSYQIKVIIDKLASQVQPDTKVFCLTGGKKLSEGKEFNELNPGLDLLISTPDRFLKHLTKKHLYFDDTKFIVIDEADSLLDKPLDEEIFKIVESLKQKKQNKSNQTQIIVVSATITKPLVSFISMQFLNMIQVTTYQVHHILPNLKQNFIKVPHFQKKEKLLQILKDPENYRKQTIIFCNSLESSEFVFNLLTKEKMEVSIMNKNIKALVS
jgi:superfamily II DNA/RNA helicase